MITLSLDKSAVYYYYSVTYIGILKHICYSVTLNVTSDIGNHIWYHIRPLTVNSSPQPKIKSYGTSSVPWPWKCIWPRTSHPRSNFLVSIDRSHMVSYMLTILTIPLLAIIKELWHIFSVPWPWKCIWPWKSHPRSNFLVSVDRSHMVSYMLTIVTIPLQPIIKELQHILCSVTLKMCLTLKMTLKVKFLGANG